MESLRERRHFLRSQAVENEMGHDQVVIGAFGTPRAQIRTVCMDAVTMCLRIPQKLAKHRIA